MNFGEVNEEVKEADAQEYDLHNEQRRLAAASQSNTPAKACEKAASSAAAAASAAASAAAAVASAAAAQPSGSVLSGALQLTATRQRRQSRPLTYDRPPEDIIELD